MEREVPLSWSQNIAAGLLSHANPVPILTSSFLKIRFAVILSSMPMSPKRSLSFRFSDLFLWAN